MDLLHVPDAVDVLAFWRYTSVSSTLKIPTRTTREVIMHLILVAKVTLYEIKLLIGFFLFLSIFGFLT